MSPNPLRVALFRGINVGGKNKLPMRDLVRLFTGLGCTDVSTYIQSGNVLFRAAPVLARSIPEGMAKLVAERFGIKTSVTLRDSEQVCDIVACNPFPQAATVAPSTVHVLFLADLPSADAAAALTPVAGSREEFILRGQEIYLHLPNGAARTKLPNFDRALSTIGTARNWRTVLQLHSLLTC